MIVAFPSAYEDELLYSILARTQVRNGTLSHKSFLQDVFGKGNITASVYLPSGIDKLVSNLPPGSAITSKQLIYRSTLFPFFSAFLPMSQKDKVFEGMSGDDGKAVYLSSGIMSSSIKSNRFLRYCVHCSLGDKAMYGELYFRRLHQIPGLDICVKHGVWLQDSKVPIHQVNKHVYIEANEGNCLLDIVATETPVELLEKYRLLSKDIEVLLNNQFPNRSLEWFGDFYLKRLRRKGYASINGGKVSQVKLREDFRSFYGADFLSQLQSDVDGEENWLNQITRKHRKTFSPLRHLLLMNFLDISLADIFHQKESYMPFGESPWYCLNPAAEHYQTRVVAELKLTTCEKTKSVIGTFECFCGFVYTRKVGDDLFKVSRVKHYGDVWVRECKRLANEGLSLREIGRKLQTDPMTIKKYLNIRGIEQVKRDITKDSKYNDFDRKEWKSLQRKHPSLSKTELRKLNPALYTRLYRSDREWLSKESPKTMNRITTTTRLNWQERDQEILEKAKEAVSTILVMEGKPKRVCISSVGYAIGWKSILERHLDKLPITKAFLVQVVENDTDYRIRKIKWAIDELSREGKEPNKWEVLRKAGIRPELINESLEAVINAGVKQL